MGSLPRRSLLGLQLGNDHAIASVLPAGAGARAGILPGDRLVSVDGRAFADARELARLVQEKGADRRFVFEVRRGPRTSKLTADAPPLPVEAIFGAEVLLSHVDANGHRLRAIFALPKERAAVGAILHLQSIRAESCEAPLTPNAPIRKLVEACVADGWVVLRVERSGVGDSEGPDPATTGLDTELAGVRAGLDALRGLDETSGLPIALFGHSLGGIIAPLVGPVDAIAAFGASALPWTEHARETSRRQRRLKGFRGVELETELGHWHEMLGLVCKEGWTPARAFTERPHLRAIRSRECDGETLYGRHVSLVRALETLDLPAAWSAFAGRTLAMHGEVDWISSREDSEGIVRACGERGELAELPGIGHDLMRHESAQSSFAEPHKGAWDGTVARRLLDWLRL